MEWKLIREGEKPASKDAELLLWLLYGDGSQGAELGYYASGRFYSNDEDINCRVRTGEYRFTHFCEIAPPEVPVETEFSIYPIKISGPMDGAIHLMRGDEITCYKYPGASVFIPETRQYRFQELQDLCREASEAMNGGQLTGNPVFSGEVK